MLDTLRALLDTLRAQPGCSIQTILNFGNIMSSLLYGAEMPAAMNTGLGHTVSKPAAGV